MAVAVLGLLAKARCQPLLVAVRVIGGSALFALSVLGITAFFPPACVKGSSWFDFMALPALFVGAAAEYGRMTAGVFGLRWLQLQVLGPIVQRVSVDVVNHLTTQKWSPEFFFHGKATPQHMPPSNREKPASLANEASFVIGGAAAAVALVVTALGAEPLTASCWAVILLAVAALFWVIPGHSLLYPIPVKRAMAL